MPQRGNNARVLKISSNGNITEILKTEEQHAMSLYFDSKSNKLYIGTAGRGLVLSVDLSTNLENPSYKTIYDTAQNEVYAITMDNIGNLYFGTATREPSYLILPSIIDGGNWRTIAQKNLEILYIKRTQTERFKDYFS